MKRMMVTAMVISLLLTFSAISSAIDIDIGGGVEIGIGGPPRIKLAEPPELVAVPGRYVYFVPDIDVDLFFYHDRWYRPYKGRWYKSANYDGSWEHIRDVPPALMDLPSDYRTIAPGYSRVPYDELRDNWERWEREKYWDRREEERQIPPRVELAGPPELVAIPGRYVYFVPDVDTDLFFYHDWWYRPYKGHWFRSDNYAGPWKRVSQVPSALIDLPPDYRAIAPGYSHVPYEELRDNWERWEREKYWDRRAGERRLRENRREREDRDLQPEGDRDRY